MWVVICLTCFVAVVALVVIVTLYTIYKKQDLVWISNRLRDQTALFQMDQVTDLAIQIPTTIFQNHKRRKIPPNLAKSIRRLQAHAPNFDYVFYDDKESREYIRTNYPQALEAYDTLLPGAYKSDLFRIVRLYCEGGIYFDAPFNPYDDDFRLRDLFRPEDTFVSANDLASRGMYNAFMASVPKHPIAKTAIDMILDNVEHRRYGKTTLSITGPSLYHQVFRKVYGEHVREGVFHAGQADQARMLAHTTFHIVEDGDIRYNCRYPSYQLDRFIYWSDTPHYSTLWNAKKVYLPRMYQTTRNTLLWSDGLFALACNLGMACYKVDTDEWGGHSKSDKVYIGDADNTFPTDFDPDLVADIYRKYRVLYVQNLDRAQLTSTQSDRTIGVPIGVDLHTLQNAPAWGYDHVMPWRKQESQLRHFRSRAPPLYKRLRHILITWTYDSTSSSRHVTPQIDDGTSAPSEYKSRMGLYRELNINPLSKLSLGMREQVWRDMGKCAFVYSPIGNGFDCHRTWEALAMGCIVIAQPNPTLQEFVGKYPIIFHNDPSKITEKDLDRWLHQYTSVPLDQLEMGAFFH